MRAGLEYLSVFLAWGHCCGRGRPHSGGKGLCAARWESCAPMAMSRGARKVATMKISVVTPSFRSSGWLKLCVASVADQAGVDVEHIVQDSKSDDGTQDWLPQDRRVKAFIEKDAGMYDAVNRGWRRASGEILAYLNCDEQYLPGGLAAVEEFFRRSPQTDVVFADTLILDKEGQFICCRKSLVPWKNVMWVFNPVISSSIFIHRRVLDKHQLFFDTQWRA